MDATDDLNANDFVKVKNFLNALLFSYDISPNGTNIGLLAFSNVAKILVPLERGTSREILTRSIERTLPMKGPRSFIKPFALAKELLGKATRSTAIGRSQIVMVTTGINRDTNNEDFSKLVTEVKNGDIVPLIVALNASDSEELQNAITRKKDLITANVPDDLKEVLGSLEGRSGTAAGLTLACFGFAL